MVFFWARELQIKLQGAPEPVKALKEHKTPKSRLSLRNSKHINVSPSFWRT
jgi:hypothetical protein